MMNMYDIPLFALCLLFFTVILLVIPYFLRSLSLAILCNVLYSSNKETLNEP